MLVTKYYVVCVGVPSGHPCVDCITIPLSVSGRFENYGFDNVKDAIREEFLKRNKAVLYILEG